MAGRGNRHTRGVYSHCYGRNRLTQVFVPEVLPAGNCMSWNRHTDVSTTGALPYPFAPEDLRYWRRTHSDCAGLAPEVFRLRQSFSCCSASAMELNVSPHERHGNSVSSTSVRSGKRGSFFIFRLREKLLCNRYATDPALVVALEWLLRFVGSLVNDPVKRSLRSSLTTLRHCT